MDDRLFASTFDDAHRALRDVARRFTAEHIAPHATAWEE